MVVKLCRRLCMEDVANDKLQRLINLWPIFAFCVTGAAYFLGYLKSFFVLRFFQVYFVPTDIFSLSNLFVSGISLMIAALIGPVICHYIGDLINYLNMKYPLFFSKIGIGFIVIIIALILNNLLTYLNHNLIPASFSFFIEDFAFGSKYKWFVKFYMIVILAGSIYTFTKPCYQEKQRYKIMFLIYFIWLFTLTVAQVYVLRDIPAGMPPSYASHESGIYGALATKYPITNGSYPKNEGDKKFYLTWGVLLTKREQVYYFIPLSMIPNPGSDLPISKIALVPDARVIGFFGEPRKHYQ